MGTFSDNPVLQKELRSQMRARRQTRGVRAATIFVVSAIVLLLYYYGARAILRSSSDARDVFTGMVFLQLLLVILLAPSLTASAITQEREQQTWNSLLLSRLTSDEIVVGKLIARLVPAAMVLTMFVPLGILAAFVGEIKMTTFGVSYLLLVFTAVFFATIGLFCSWAWRRSVAATSATFGAIAFLVVGTALLWGLWAIAHPTEGNDVESFPLMWLNPFVAVSIVVSQIGQGDPNIAPLIAFLIACVLGTLGLLWATIRRLSFGPKELEQ
jgi:ABC-type transport system involved in multi-copper enzyme maturation permease subunit